MGHRDGGRFSFPDPTHRAADSNGPGLFPDQQRLVTAWDAIGGLEPSADEHLEPKGRWADLLPSVPEGENYLWHTNRKGGMRLFGWRTHYWSFLLKLAKNRPSWTLQAQPGPAIGPFHWNNRRLSTEEMARIQTFPHGLAFIGSRLSLQRQIGNAVPSLLAEVLARAIASQFFGAPHRQPPSLAVPLQRPIPPPERVGAVPPQFRHLEADHPDHPGTGRGRAALQRAALA